MIQGKGASSEAPRPVIGPDPEGPVERVEYVVFRVDEDALRNVTPALSTSGEAWRKVDEFDRKSKGGALHVVLRREVSVTEWEAVR